MRALQAGIAELALQIGDRDFAEMVSAASALAERHFVEIALQRNAGDVASAAAMLGLSTDSLHRRMRVSTVANETDSP